MAIAAWQNAHVLCRSARDSQSSQRVLMATTSPSTDKFFSTLKKGASLLRTGPVRCRERVLHRLGLHGGDRGLDRQHGWVTTASSVLEGVNVRGVLYGGPH